jgi:hypothetical protein
MARKRYRKRKMEQNFNELELHGRYVPLSFVGSIGPLAQSQCVFVPIGVSGNRARAARV